MSYSTSVYGHGADLERVKAAFEQYVRALRAATQEGGTPPGGFLSATEGDESLSISAESVPDESEGESA